MDYMASFAQAFIASKYPDEVPGTDYAFFPFPTIDADNAGSLTVGADIVTMVKDTPNARAFMSYLAGAKAQEAWIRLGGFTSVNRSVSPDAYGDPVARAIAAHLAGAKVTRFGAGDLMPAAVQGAWWQAMLELVADPGQLDSKLESLTSMAAAAAPSQ
ncbi:MAG TPA: extracellular solute-binding protein [Candidatus Limnocylindrales bacterium]|jgi:alpha-glucoside transport system substrate-binding protein